MAKGWRTIFGREDPPPAAPPTPAPEDEIGALRDGLRAIIAKVNASAGRLPGSVVVQVHRIEDVLRELIDHADHAAGGQLGAMEMVSLEAAITDYLPTSIERFLALPLDFVNTHRTAQGLTPAEELREQLVLLEHGVRELAQAVYSGDAARLSAQGRFLQTKFSRSDLDLA